MGDGGRVSAVVDVPRDGCGDVIAALLTGALDSETRRIRGESLEPWQTRETARAMVAVADALQAAWRGKPRPGASAAMEAPDGWGAWPDPGDTGESLLSVIESTGETRFPSWLSGR